VRQFKLSNDPQFFRDDRPDLKNLLQFFQKKKPTFKHDYRPGHIGWR
jgi:hypothetical protein